MLRCVKGNLTYPDVSKEYSMFIFKGWYVLEEYSSSVYQPMKFF